MTKQLSPINPPPAEGEVAKLAIGVEWQPCVKRPITVHVREQRPGEQHVSTREGITPLRPDDMIMRGVKGEEYPIERDLFLQTYDLGCVPQPAAEGEVAELVEWLQELAARKGGCFDVSLFCANLNRAAALLQQQHPQSVPVSERPWEREGWCDEKGWCWWFDSEDMSWVFDDSSTSQFWATYVLPAHALPLPKISWEVGDGMSANLIA